MTSLDEDFRQAFLHYRSSPLFSPEGPYDEQSELDFSSELARYLKRVGTFRDRELTETALAIADQIRFPAETRQIRAIPAHLLEEISVLALGMRKVDMVRNKVHTVILLNAALSALEEGVAEQKQSTVQRRIQEAGLGDLITVAMCQFPRRMGMGTVRGLLNDACMVAAAKCGIQDPILISSDVDILDVSPSYFDAITDHFAKPSLDVLTGPIYYGYSPEGQEFSVAGSRLASPELVLGNRVFAARRALMLSGRMGGGRLFTTEGPNSVFRASAICAAGGYDYSLSLNEDGMMGNAIFAIRNSRHSPYPSTSNADYDYRLWLATDPRRTLRAISFDRCIRDSWRYVHFSEQDGHDIDLVAIVDRYSHQASLLQISDMEFPVDRPLSGRLRERIIKVFLTSLANTEFGVGDLDLYGRYFGITADRITTDSVEGDVFATPDLHSAFQRV